MEIKKIEAVNKIGDFLKKNNTTIMFVSGAVTVATALYFTVTATIKAKDELEDDEIVTEDDNGNEIITRRTLVDTLKLIGKTYWLPATLAVTGLGLMTASHIMECGKSASAAMAAGMAAQSLNEYKQKVADKDAIAKDVMGEKKYEQYKQKVAEKAVDDNPPWEDDNPESTAITQYDGTLNEIKGDGCCRTLDLSSGRYFWASADKLHLVEARLNETLKEGTDVYLNDLYDIINDVCGTDLEYTSSGSSLSWRGGDRVTFELHSDLRNGTPILVFDFNDFCRPMMRTRW